jgi:NAD(P)-dependent dehydrogenase (short-subunit alcohol dehydrogenase family)
MAGASPIVFDEEKCMTGKPLCAVVGAGPGLGVSIARRFARDGFRVALFSRKGPEPEARGLRGEGFDAAGHALDCGDFGAVQAALGGLGPVRVLVYNAVGVTPGTPLDLTPAGLMADLAVSVGGAVAACQAVAPGMNGGSSILLTGGGFALRPMARMASVGMGKAALRNLAFSLDETLGPRGVRVGTVTIMGMVAPGSRFDPDAIAQYFMALHADREGHLGVEATFKGEVV